MLPTTKEVSLALARAARARPEWRQMLATLGTADTLTILQRRMGLDPRVQDLLEARDAKKGGNALYRLIAMAILDAAAEGHEEDLAGLIELVDDPRAMQAFIRHAGADLAESVGIKRADGVELLEGWMAARTKRGTMKAVGTGDQHGRTLYGKRAEQALRGKTKHGETAQTRKEEHAERSESVKKTVGKITSYEDIGQHEIENLVENLPHLRVKQLREIRARLAATFGGGRRHEQMVDALRTFVREKLPGRMADAKLRGEEVDRKLRGEDVDPGSFEDQYHTLQDRIQAATAKLETLVDGESDDEWDAAMAERRTAQRALDKLVSKTDPKKVASAAKSRREKKEDKVPPQDESVDAQETAPPDESAGDADQAQDKSEPSEAPEKSEPATEEAGSGEPWAMTAAEFAASPPKGYAYKQKDQNAIARYRPDGKIEITDAFFEHSLEDRKHIIAHEKGHGVVDHVSKDEKQFWPLVDSGLLGTYDEKKERFVGISKNQRNADEVLADAVADYTLDPIKLKEKHPSLFILAKHLSDGGKITPEIIEKAKEVAHGPRSESSDRSMDVLPGDNSRSSSGGSSRTKSGRLVDVELPKKLPKSHSDGAADSSVRGSLSEPDEPAESKEASTLKAFETALKKSDQLALHDLIKDGLRGAHGPAVSKAMARALDQYYDQRGTTGASDAAKHEHVLTALRDAAGEPHPVDPVTPIYAKKREVPTVYGVKDKKVADVFPVDTVPTVWPERTHAQLDAAHAAIKAVGQHAIKPEHKQQLDDLTRRIASTRQELDEIDAADADLKEKMGAEGVTTRQRQEIADKRRDLRAARQAAKFQVDHIKTDLAELRAEIPELDDALPGDPEGTPAEKAPKGAASPYHTPSPADIARLRKAEKLPTEQPVEVRQETPLAKALRNKADELHAEQNSPGEIDDYLDASKYPTKEEYIQAEHARLKKILPDDDDETLRAQSEMWANDRWKPLPEKGKYEVGQTVSVDGQLGSYRGTFTHSDGKKYAVIAGGNAGQYSVPIEKVEPGNFKLPDVDARESHQKTWDERRKELLQGYMSGGRTKPIPSELQKMKMDHHDKVMMALAAGKPVPPEVLADYPDLAAKYQTTGSQADTITPSPEAANVTEPTPATDPGSGPGPVRQPVGRGDHRGSVAGDDGGSGGQRPAGPTATPKIVTVRPDRTQPAIPELVPAAVRPHLNEAQVHGVSLGINAMTKHGGFVLADGTGVGKSRELLAVGHHWIDQGKKVIIVTPPEVVKPNWAKMTMDPGSSFVRDANTLGLRTKLIKTPDQIDPGAVNFASYSQISKLVDGVDENTVVLFDESHFMKNKASARSKHGTEIAKKAAAVMYASATPADKPLHIAHLARAGVFGNAGVTKTYEKLGLHLVEKRVRGGDFRKVWEAKVPKKELARRIEGLFDQMTKDGLMIRRELSMDNVEVGTHEIELTPDQHARMSQVYQDKLRETEGNKAVALMAARLHQEPYKIPAIVQMVKDELASGRRPVVFVGRVNDIEDGDDDAITPEESEDGAINVQSEGTAPALVEALKAAGIMPEHIGQLHGGATKTAAQKQKAMADFQAGKSHVMVATIQSGGTGVNLDDTVGDKPRTLIIATPPLTANDMAQAMGRIHRLNTKSQSKVIGVMANTHIDQWNARLLEEKFRTQGAVISGAAKRGIEALRKPDEWDDIEENQTPFEWGETLHQVPKHYYNTPYHHNDLIKDFGGRRTQRNGQWTTEFPSKEHFERYQAATAPKPAQTSTAGAGAGSATPTPAPAAAPVVEPTPYISDEHRAAIHSAIRQLAGNDTDRARERNSVGFNQMDSEFGASLAAADRLTDRQAHAAAKMLAKYHRQLDPATLERIKRFDEAPPQPAAPPPTSTSAPTPAPAASKPQGKPSTISGVPIKAVNTRNGPRHLWARENPPESFWRVWKAKKEQIKALGVSAKPNQRGVFELAIWGSSPDEVERIHGKLVAMGAGI